LEVSGLIKASDIHFGTGGRASSNQGGSFELGDSLVAGVTPYIDFHYGTGSQQDHNMRIINDANGRLSITGGNFVVDGGRVGIGTTNPLRHLQVDGGSCYSGELLISGTGKWDPNQTNPAPSFKEESWTYACVDLLDRTNDRVWHISHRNAPWVDQKNKLMFWYCTNTCIVGKDQTYNNVMTLTPDGQVGIGTSDPQYSFEIKASSGIKLGLEGSGGGQLIIANNKDDNRIYLEAFSSDGTGIASELLLTGRHGKNVPKLSFRADLTAVSGNVVVDGKIKADSILSKPELFTFKVEGDVNKYYPIVFRDDGWDDGPMILEITRPNVHTDKDWFGSLSSKFTCHSTRYGHGADFIRAEIYCNVQQFIAGYKNIDRDRKLVVWLRGQTTYQWRANQFVVLEDQAATEKTVTEENLPIKDAVDSYVQCNGINFDKNLTVTGDLTVGGRGSGSCIKVRHINGKDYLSDNDDALFLNWNTGKKVVIGRPEMPAALSVYGNIEASSSIKASDIRFGSGGWASWAHGGSIELGDSLVAGVTPYIDFHYGTGSQQDHNMRIINDAAGRLSINGGNLVVAGGNVGIGTTSPGNLLEIKNSGGTTPGVVIGNGTGRYQLGVGIVTANDGKFGIYDFKGSSNRFVIDTNGNVGIGTTNPTAKLDVNGTLRARAMRVAKHVANVKTRVELYEDQVWRDFPELELKCELGEEAEVIVFYGISMVGTSVADGFRVPREGYLRTRLRLDGQEIKETRCVTGNTLFWSPSCVWVGSLTAGAHTFKVEYSSDHSGTLDPNEDYGKGTLSVTVFGVG
jgi:hypothetical protein